MWHMMNVKSLYLCDVLFSQLMQFILLELYDMPLKSITATWESGKLLSCGFTSSEVYPLSHSVLISLKLCVLKVIRWWFF